MDRSIYIGSGMCWGGSPHKVQQGPYRVLPRVLPQYSYVYSSLYHSSPHHFGGIYQNPMKTATYGTPDLESFKLGYPNLGDRVVKNRRKTRVGRGKPAGVLGPLDGPLDLGPSQPCITQTGVPQFGIPWVGNPLVGSLVGSLVEVPYAN